MSTLLVSISGGKYAVTTLAATIVVLELVIDHCTVDVSISYLQRSLAGLIGAHNWILVVEGDVEVGWRLSARLTRTEIKSSSVVSHFPTKERSDIRNANTFLLVVRGQVQANNLQLIASNGNRIHITSQVIALAGTGGNYQADLEAQIWFVCVGGAVYGNSTLLHAEASQLFVSVASSIARGHGYAQCPIYAVAVLGSIFGNKVTLLTDAGFRMQAQSSVTLNGPSKAENRVAVTALFVYGQVLGDNFTARASQSVFDFYSVSSTSKSDSSWWTTLTGPSSVIEIRGSIGGKGSQLLLASSRVSIQVSTVCAATFTSCSIDYGVVVVGVGGTVTLPTVISIDNSSVNVSARHNSSNPAPVRIYAGTMRVGGSFVVLDPSTHNASISQSLLRLHAVHLTASSSFYDTRLNRYLPQYMQPFNAWLSKPSSSSSTIILLPVQVCNHTDDDADGSAVAAAKNFFGCCFNATVASGEEDGQCARTIVGPSAAPQGGAESDHTLAIQSIKPLRVGGASSSCTSPRRAGGTSLTRTPILPTLEDSAVPTSQPGLPLTTRSLDNNPNGTTTAPDGVVITTTVSDTTAIAASSSSNATPSNSPTNTPAGTTVVPRQDRTKTLTSNLLAVATNATSLLSESDELVNDGAALTTSVLATASFAIAALSGGPSDAQAFALMSVSPCAPSQMSSASRGTKFLIQPLTLPINFGSSPNPRAESNLVGAALGWVVIGCGLAALQMLFLMFKARRLSQQQPVVVAPGEGMATDDDTTDTSSLLSSRALAAGRFPSLLIVLWKPLIAGMSSVCVRGVFGDTESTTGRAVCGLLYVVVVVVPLGYVGYSTRRPNLDAEIFIRFDAKAPPPGGRGRKILEALRLLPVGVWLSTSERSHQWSSMFHALLPDGRYRGIGVLCFTSVYASAVSLPGHLWGACQMIAIGSSLLAVGFSGFVAVGLLFRRPTQTMRFVLAHAGTALLVLVFTILNNSGSTTTTSAQSVGIATGLCSFALFVVAVLDITVALLEHFDWKKQLQRQRMESSPINIKQQEDDSPLLAEVPSSGPNAVEDAAAKSSGASSGKRMAMEEPPLLVRPPQQQQQRSALLTMTTTGEEKGRSSNPLAFKGKQA